MITIDNIKQLKQTLKEQNGKVGFVPTMGALHDGHLTLMRESVANNDHTIVSIFVNPTQFLVGEDLDKYPRDEEGDRLKCKDVGVDAIFMPTPMMMYSEDELSIKAPNIRGFVLEGYNRPTHFDGVLQVVLKLFNLVKPTNGYFGKKDAQQLLLIKHMVDRLFLDINIVPMEIVREDDGLAMSSRNVYLSSEQRIEALKISKSLFFAKELIDKGEICYNIIKQNIVESLNPLDIEYVQIVTTDLKIADKIQRGNTIILIAVKIGNTRLIDNIWI